MTIATSLSAYGEINIIEKVADAIPTSLNLIFVDEKDCEEVEILGRRILLNRKIFDKEDKYLTIAANPPTRIKVVKAGKRITNNHIPVVGLTNNLLKIAIPKDSSDKFINGIICSSLETLIGKPPKDEDFSLLCKQMSIGIKKEAETLKEKEASNRKQGNDYLAKGMKFIEAADRQRKMLNSLDEIETTMAAKYAKEQWDDICGLIPDSLQSVKIEDKNIVALTAPIILLGNFMGAYRIIINIETGAIRIYGATEGINITGSYPHPHVQSNGSVCWGNLTNNISEFVAAKDYFQLILSGLRLLNQYNRESQYTSLSNWGSTYSGDLSETTRSDCRDRGGPKYSLAQAKKCIKCEATSSNCSYKQSDSAAIYSNCYKLSSYRECVDCDAKDCPHFEARYTRCFEGAGVQGIPFCMLKCTHAECTYRERAQEACKNSNLRKDGTCPASDVCWNPCCKKEE